jgi:hypothetical protein
MMHPGMDEQGMSASPRTHYLNVDFDLGLRPRPRGLEKPAIVRQLRELSAQAILGAEAGDAALVRAEIPENFVDYLEGCGVSVPRIVQHPRADPQLRLRPFGWSTEAIELNREHARPVRHPDAETIALVNTRSFALKLEHELTPHDRLGAVIETAADVETFLSRADPASEWVIKADHGNSGLGNRRLSARELTDPDRRFVEGLFAEDDRLVIEPWLLRERDWCVVFDVPFDPRTLRVHETICTRDGALIGALFDPDATEHTRWAEELAATAQSVAARLHDQGYFGPVCLDAICWRDADRIRLRPLVDLNCRLSMSDGAHRLWRRHAADRVLYYRFFNRRKLRLPDELAHAADMLGERHFDRNRRVGILFGSPFRLGGKEKSWRPMKTATIFVARSRSEVFALEHDFRTTFEC